MKPAKDPDVLTVDGDLADPATADRIISGELGHCGCIEALVNNADVYISKRAIHRAVIPEAPQNLQIWAVATTSESTDHMDTESAFCAARQDVGAGPPSPSVTGKPAWGSSVASAAAYYALGKSAAQMSAHGRARALCQTSCHQAIPVWARRGWPQDRLPKSDSQNRR
jgi:hypothetical protein